MNRMLPRLIRLVAISITCLSAHKVIGVQIQPSFVKRSHSYIPSILRLRNGSSMHNEPAILTTEENESSCTDNSSTAVSPEGSTLSEINPSKKYVISSSETDETNNVLPETNLSTSITTENELTTAPPSQTDETPTVSIWSRPLKVLLLSSFLETFSNCLVFLFPAPTLVAKLGSSRATSILSALSASAAAIQIIFSPVLGSVIDSTGRKPTILSAIAMGAVAQGAVALHPSIACICASRFVGTICSGFSTLSSQAMISDIMASNPTKMSSVIGTQMAILTTGFLFGTIVGGQLSDFGLPTVYGIATIVGTISLLLVKFCMVESLPLSKRVPLKSKNMKKLMLQSPLASVRLLFRHGKEVRALAIVLMLQSLPQNMGEFFQVFAKTEWNLATKGFSSFVAMFGVLGIIANITGSMLVQKVGIKYFTGIAILSSMISPMGALLFGFKGMKMGAIFGFLSSAQTVGILAALVSQGMKSGIPQGELAGERSSLLTLLKIVGPILYSSLYIQGQNLLGTSYLPFLFNIGVGVIALVFSQMYLS